MVNLLAYSCLFKHLEVRFEALFVSICGIYSSNVYKESNHSAVFVVFYFLKESSVSHTESVQSAEWKSKSRVSVEYLNTERGEREGGSLVIMKGAFWKFREDVSGR